MRLHTYGRRIAGVLITLGFSALLSSCLVTNTDGDTDTIDLCDDLSRFLGDASHTLRIAKPNGGESFRVGQELDITICASPEAMADLLVNLSWSVDGGESWVDVPGTNDGSLKLSVKNTYAFTIPASETFTRISDFEAVNLSTVTEKAMVRVYEYVDNSVYDISDAHFTILQH